MFTKMVMQCPSTWPEVPPTDGLGAEYEAAFLATQLVRVLPKGHCRSENTAVDSPAPGTLVSFPLMIRFLVSLVMVVAAGCAPVISEKALEPVDQSLGFESLLANPERYAGKIVLLGGDIIETELLPSKTSIVVLQRPLGSRAQPSKGKGSKGRFIVMAEGFLDPAIYRAGRQVTLVGEVVGREVRPLGQIQYGYPLIANKELYLWPVEEASKKWRFYIGASSVIAF